MRPIAGLVVLAGLCGAGGLEPASVWSGPGVTLLGAPSRDGRLLSFADPVTHNLALRELATGQIRLLTHKRAESGEFAYFSVIARDSSRVAYAWFNEDGFYDLRVISAEGGEPRVLYRNPESGFVQPCAFSADGKFVLTLLFRSDNISQIALVPVEGGAPKVLRSLNWVYPKRMDLSPDGRYIVYDSLAGDGAQDRTIYVLATDGSREQKLITAPGNYLFPLWLPDGKGIVYASDRSGTMDAWELAMAEGKPQGVPKLVRRDLGRFLPMGVTAAGELFYGMRTGSTDVFVMGLGAAASEARRATLAYPGRNVAPDWSPDGGRLAYLSRRGSENFGQETREIVIRDIAAGKEREVPCKLAYLEHVRWSPDGKTLLASGSDNKGRGGLFLVDAETGSARPFAADAGGPFRGYAASWSADGSAVFYVRAGELRRRVVETGAESTLLRGGGLEAVAASRDGKWVAVADAHQVLLVLLAGGEQRRIEFAGVTELEWGAELVAGKGNALFRLSPEGGAPVELRAPGNRNAGFSVHPDGKQVAVTAGNEKSEVWKLSLP